jgi:hypothetical protein
MTSPPTNYAAKNYQKPKRRFSGQQSIGSALNHITRPIFKQRGIVDNRLFLDWPRIVGEVVAAHSMPRRITYRKDSHQQGTLMIDVFHSGLATELEYMKEIIIEKIAVFYGFQAIGDLRIMQSPKPLNAAPPPAPFYQKESVSKVDDSALEGISDDSLKAALSKLGRHV